MTDRDSTVPGITSVTTGRRPVESLDLNNGQNTNRVGEFAIGTNVAVTRLNGNVLEDEKAAGVHIAFGDPLGEETGAKWKVNPMQHCDIITQGCTIVVDGRTIMEN